MTNASFEDASYKKLENSHFLTRPMMKWLLDAYTTDVKQRHEIYVSPLLATPEPFKGLPQALVITAEKDVLHDEGEAYGRKLGAAGVPTVVTRYNGMSHDFDLLNALSDAPSVRAALNQASETIKASLT